MLPHVKRDDLFAIWKILAASGLAAANLGLAGDIIACPGLDYCSLATARSIPIAQSISRRFADLNRQHEIGPLRINISGCTNSCGQHHISDIGFFGAERRAHGRSAPGYQMLLGGYVGQEKVHFGDKALRLPAKNAAEATVRVVRRFSDERQAGESFREWMDRTGGAKEIAAGLKELDVFPTPDEAPEYYVDYDETGPYEAEVGAGECAGV